MMLQEMIYIGAMDGNRQVRACDASISSMSTMYRTDEHHYRQPNTVPCVVAKATATKIGSSVMSSPDLSIVVSL